MPELGSKLCYVKGEVRTHVVDFGSALFLPFDVSSVQLKERLNHPLIVAVDTNMLKASFLSNDAKPMGT